MFSVGILAFIQVIVIDIVLSGDNAIVIGALAAGLPVVQRNKAIFFGMIIAVALRIILSLGVVWLLQIPGVMIIGGSLLLYVAWKMYCDLTDAGGLDGSNEVKTGTFLAAMVSITMADLSMSLDNVLGVAGAAGTHWQALVFGLVLSVALMGFAAKIVSSLVDRHKWVAWVGLALIVFVAGRMIYHGIPQLMAFF